MKRTLVFSLFSAAVAVVPGMYPLVGPFAAAGTDDGVVHLFNGKDLSGFYTYLVRRPRASRPTARTTIRRKSSPSTTA